MIAAATECAEAHERPELRGIDPEDVALLVASRGSGRLVHACFTELVRFLRSGDLPSGRYGDADLKVELER